jgi:hypothetical protein
MAGCELVPLVKKLCRGERNEILTLQLRRHTSRRKVDGFYLLTLVFSG